MSFVIGDRVNVHGCMKEDRSNITVGAPGLSHKGKVLEVYPGVLKVQLTSPLASGIILAHERQCRKLVRPVRRRIFVDEGTLANLARNQLAGLTQARITNCQQFDDSVEFVEVRKKK